MGESSRKIQITSTYSLSLVGVDITFIQANSSTIDVEASTLPNAEHGKSPGSFPHGGNGGKFREGSERKHLPRPVDLVEEKYMP